MTVVTNIFYSLSAWQSSHSYSVGDRVSNGGNAYHCITAGQSASSGGPSGTGSNITDNVAHWKYLAHIDYTSCQQWADAIPASLTDAVVGRLWDTGAISTSVVGDYATPYLSLSGHSTTTTYTITLTAAPGEGIRDSLATNSAALFSNASQYVRFILPNAPGNINYFEIDDANVILDGLQIIDQNSSSNCSLIGGNGSSTTIRNCVLDGYAHGDSGAYVIAVGGTIHIYNSLLLNRDNGAQPLLDFDTGSTLSTLDNCTLVSLNSGAGDALVANDSLYIKNCAFFGFNYIGGGASGNYIQLDNCATDLASGSVNANVKNNVTYSLSAGSQFVDSTADFRIKAGSALIAAGVADTTDIPSADDIAGHARSGAWDIGAWEYFLLASAQISFTLSASGSAALTTPTDNASAAVLIVLKNTTSLGQSDITTAAARVVLATTTSLGQSNPVSATAVLSLSAAATAIIRVYANATITLPLSVSGSIDDWAYAATALTLSATGYAVVGDNTYCYATGTLSLSALSSVTLFSNAAAASSFPVFTTWGSSLFQTNNASAVAGSSLTVASSLGQANRAQTIATIALTTSSQFGNSVAAAVNIAISAAAQLAQYGAMAGTSTLLRLATYQAVPQILLADGTNIPLAADGTGILLMSDATALTYNMGQSAPTAGTFKITWTAAGSVASQWLISSAASLPGFAAVGALGQLVAATARSSLVFSANSTAYTTQPGYCLSYLPSVQAVGQVLANPTMVARVTVPLGVVATAAMLGAMSSTVSLPALTATATAVLSQAQAVIALPPLGAVVQLGSSLLITATASIRSTVSGQLGLTPLPLITATASIVAATTGQLGLIPSDLATATVRIGLAAAASAGQQNNATGLASVALGAVVRLLQANPASAVASLPAPVLAAEAGQSILAAGAISLLAPSAAVSAFQAVQTAGRASLPPLTSTGFCIAQSLPMTATIALPFGAVGSALLFGNAFAGTASLPALTCVAPMTSQTFARTLAALAALATSSGRLYETPIGYVTGDDVVWWPN